MGRFLYSFTNIVSEIKSKRERWSGHVAKIRNIINICKIMYDRPEGKRLLSKHGG